MVLNTKSSRRRFCEVKYVKHEASVCAPHRILIQLLWPPKVVLSHSTRTKGRPESDGRRSEHQFLSAVMRCVREKERERGRQIKMNLCDLSEAFSSTFTQHRQNEWMDESSFGFPR